MEEKREGQGKGKENEGENEDEKGKEIQGNERRRKSGGKTEEQME